MPARIAEQTLRRRGLAYTGEVRRLLDAALEVMERGGTEHRARVADIVAAAGLSNDAFYRHFRSKDALVDALLEDGAERLQSYLTHHMGKATTPEGQIRSWVDGVLAQAHPSIASTTLAVLHNSAGAAEGRASGRHFASGQLATLLVEPLAALGSAAPELDAALTAHSVLGLLTDHLWLRTEPTSAEADHVVERCVAAIRPTRPRRTRRS